jgi:hypothetical protein
MCPLYTPGWLAGFTLEWRSSVFVNKSFFENLLSLAVDINDLTRINSIAGLCSVYVVDMGVLFDVYGRNKFLIKTNKKLLF